MNFITQFRVNRLTRKVARMTPKERKEFYIDVEYKLKELGKSREEIEIWKDITNKLQ